MEKKLLFLVNPVAGKGRIKSQIYKALEVFARHGYSPVVHITKGRDDTVETAVRYGGDYDLIVCAGGDGTLSEVVNGVLCCGGKKPAIGYIPMGTTNDFAATLGISPTNTGAAAEIAVNGCPLACDIGRFNEKYFTYSAAFGAFTDVPYITTQKAKNIFGRAAYILQSVERLSSLRSYELSVTHDGEVISGDFLVGMVTNSDSVAGFKGLMGDGVELADGLFETILVKMPRNIIELQQVVMALLSHEFNAPGLYYFKTSSLRIDASEPIAWTLDGEFGGAVKTAKLSVIKKAVRYMLCRP